MFNNDGGVHMYSPQVENSINTYFQAQNRQDIDVKLKSELLQEEQERAIEYLNSTSRKKIQELGREKRTPLVIYED